MISMEITFTSKTKPTKDRALIKYSITIYTVPTNAPFNHPIPGFFYTAPPINVLTMVVMVTIDGIALSGKSVCYNYCKNKILP